MGRPGAVKPGDGSVMAGLGVAWGRRGRLGRAGIWVCQSSAVFWGRTSLLPRLPGRHAVMWGVYLTSPNQVNPPSPARFSARFGGLDDHLGDVGDVVIGQAARERDGQEIG